MTTWLDGSIAGDHLLASFRGWQLNDRAATAGTKRPGTRRDPPHRLHPIGLGVIWARIWFKASLCGDGQVDAVSASSAATSVVAIGRACRGRGWRTSSGVVTSAGRV